MGVAGTVAHGGAGSMEDGGCGWFVASGVLVFSSKVDDMEVADGGRVVAAGIVGHGD
ncbi:hypothetical protein DEO72_LG5g1653 [Vigna unguiculata]|uniref:Uncharacterized protein n=1 Tax=Vigna unguiculata TaxID=3917 RepID=A0A4D6LZ11_VIGUN|nr:hypothetical protein DEO72_LG5g1653 [Vigna unguiculata]